MICKTLPTRVFWVFVLMLSLSAIQAQKGPLGGGIIIDNCDPEYPCELDAEFSFSVNDCEASFQGVLHPSECNVREIWLIQGASISLLGNTVSYIFTESGAYEICHTVQGLDDQFNVICSETYCQKVEIICGCPEPPLRDIEFTTVDCYVHDFYTSPGIIPGETYAWDLDGDGIFENAGGSTTTTFPADGIYPIALQITNACGNSIVLYDQIIVDCCSEPEPREILAEQSPDDCTRYDFSFTPGPQPGESYEWDVNGDGIIDGSGPTISGSYPVNGVYEVTLYIKNECDIIRVVYELKVDCCALPDDRDILFSQASSNCYTYDFHMSSLGMPGEIVEWDLDNSGAYGSSTTITFPADGTYLVNMRVVNECGERIFTLEVEVSCTDCDWPKGYGNSTTTLERGDGLVMDASGNVFVHGLIDATTDFEGFSIPGGAFLAKYDNCGLLLWVQDVSAYGFRATKMDIDNLGNPILLANDHSGNTASVNTDVEYRLTKFSNNTGSAIWSVSLELFDINVKPSFDINMNTNEVYLTANVRYWKYLRIKQADGTLIVDYTTPPLTSTHNATNYLGNTTYIVKLDASGNQIWQDHILSFKTSAHFYDVAVDENTNRAYVVGGIGGNPSNGPYSASFGSNPAIVMNSTPGFDSGHDFFLASYDALGNISYSIINPLIEMVQGSQLEFSNTDQQLYLLDGDPAATPGTQLFLLGTFGNIISSTFVQQGQVGKIHYNQTDNYLLIPGRTSTCGGLAVGKYIGTTNVWNYETGPYPCSSTGVVYSVFTDPISDRIFMTGSFYNQNLTFNTTDVLPFAGGLGRDIFIARIKDEGSTVSYKQGNGSSVDLMAAEQGKASLIEVYPNPTNAVIHINMSAGQGELELLNVNGAVIDQQKIQSENQVLTFDLASQPTGLYLIRFIDAHGKIELKKVVKH